MAWMIARDESLYLAHHGIKGQKWGVRRYQNYDGTLTALGKIRYSKNVYNELKDGDFDSHKKISNDLGKNAITRNLQEKANLFNKLRSKEARDKAYDGIIEFEDSDDWKEAYKESIEDAKEYVKEYPQVPLDEIVDYYFYDGGYEQKARDKWKEREQNKKAVDYENKLNDSYSKMYGEARKIVDNMLSDKYRNKWISVPNQISGNNLNTVMADMLVDEALKRSK